MKPILPSIYIDKRKKTEKYCIYYYQDSLKDKNSKKFKKKRIKRTMTFLYI